MKRSVSQGGIGGDKRRRSRTVPPTAEAVIFSHEQARIFDISQDAIFLWRKPGGIEFWNRGATELYGFTPQEAIGRLSHDLLRTKFPQALEEIEDELLARGSWSGELRHITRDGHEIIVSSRFQVVSQSGNEILILESTRDITEAKQNEERLERRLREQAVVAQFCIDALQAANVQTICHDATDVLARELGVDFSSLFELSTDGKTLLLRSGVGWKPGIVGKVQIPTGEETVIGRALELNQPIIVTDVGADRQLRLPEFIREHKVLSSLAVVIPGREYAYGVLSVDSIAARSFTDEEVHFLESIGNVFATAVSRILFEQELRDTTGRLRGIVETAVDGIITIDERGIVETMNPAAERIFGYNAGEVIGKNVSMLMPEPYRSEHDSYLDRYRRTGERRIIGIGREVRGRRKDGTEFPMDLAVSATNLAGRRIFTGLVRDISTRKKLEQEILEISDREQRRIGSDLHDDLCQRLAGVRFSVDVLKKMVSQKSPEITRRVEKVAADVSDAIDRTRMLARGMAPVAPERNGLASAVQELAQNISALFKVKCVVRSKGTVEVKDPIAATHLYRITQEAINNALRHARPTQIVISLAKAANKKTLTIEDNGVGFAAQEAQRTAEGMGLRSIAYRAGMIDADVQVQSAPGSGTKIICTFAADL